MPEVSKKPVPKWLAIGVVVVAIFAIGTMSRVLGGKAVEGEYEPTPAPAVARTPSFATGEVTDATVRTALGTDIDLVSIEVQDHLGTGDAEDKIVHVTYKPAGVADSSPRLTLSDLAAVSATVFEKLFANDAVTAVDVTAQVAMVGTDGSERAEAAARIFWDRKKADSVDFGEYRENVAESYFWDAYVGAPDFYVHPGVLAGLDAADRAKLQK